jgi:hypothetical protein
MVARTVCSSRGLTGVYSAAEVVTDVIEACEDVDVVIDRAYGLDRHFCKVLAACMRWVSEVAHCAARCERILPYRQSAQLVCDAPHWR